MDWLYFILIGGALGWMVGWATDRKGSKMVGPIGVGAVGGLAGGYLIVLLIQWFDVLAHLAGAALGAMVLLSFATKKGVAKLAKK